MEGRSGIAHAFVPEVDGGSGGCFGFSSMHHQWNRSFANTSQEHRWKEFFSLRHFDVVGYSVRKWLMRTLWGVGLFRAACVVANAVALTRN